MATVILQGTEEEVHIPTWVVDLESFRRWYNSDDFPESGRIDYIQGAVWVDTARQAQTKAYRWTFLLSGIAHPNFDRSLRELTPRGHARVAELARAIA